MVLKSFCMVTDGYWAYCVDQFVIQRDAESPYYIPETNTIHNKKKEGRESSRIESHQAHEKNLIFPKNSTFIIGNKYCQLFPLE